MLLLRYQFAAGFWGEEPYGLATPLRYWMGDRPLVDSWDTNFSWSIVAMPFVGFWINTIGSTDGILLAYRGFFYLMTIFAAVAAYAALKDHMARWLALTVGLLIVLYLPYQSPFGYGADVQWHMIAPFAALWVFSHKKTGLVNALPGLLTGMGIVAHPPTIVVVPFFAAALWFAYRDSGERPLRVVGWYSLGLFSIGFIFLAALSWLSGPELFSSVGHWAAPDDHDFGIFAQLRNAWAARWVFVVPLVIGISCGLAGRILPKHRAHWTVAITLASCLAASLWTVATDRVMLIFSPQSILFMVSAGLYIMFLISGRTPKAAWRWLLLLPAIGVGLGWFLGSNQGVFTGVQASPLLLATALSYWPATEHSAKQSDAQRLPSIALLWTLILAVAVFGMAWTPLGPVAAMTTVVDRGPFKGIRTFPSDAAAHARVYNTLKALPPIEGRIAFIERMPVGYLIDGSLPGTYSTWLTSATSERMNDYLDQTGNIPARVVLARFPAEGPDGFPASVRLRGFPALYDEVYFDDDIRVYDAR